MWLFRCFYQYVDSDLALGEGQGWAQSIEMDDEWKPSFLKEQAFGLSIPQAL